MLNNKNITLGPLPASKKIYVKSNRFEDVEVAMRQVNLSKNSDNKNFILYSQLKDNNSLKDYIFECGGEDITMETNSEITDHHLGENGHKIQSELFYDYITNKQKLI